MLPAATTRLRFREMSDVDVDLMAGLLGGEFVGDCGLTWQIIDDDQVLEIGYHTVHRLQGHGYATEAARACLDLATGPIGEAHVVAIINPDNVPSRRVAEKMGMRVEQETHVFGRPVVVYGRH